MTPRKLTPRKLPDPAQATLTPRSYVTPRSYPATPRAATRRKPGLTPRSYPRSYPPAQLPQIRAAELRDQGQPELGGQRISTGNVRTGKPKGLLRSAR